MKKRIVPINEVRRPVKCEIKDWAPLEESVEYKDMIGVGWERVTTAQRQNQGNLQFFHPEFRRFGKEEGYPIFKINHHSIVKGITHLGTIMIMVAEEDSFEINNWKKSPITAAGYRNYEHLIKRCATWEDYLPKMNFLMKLLLKKRTLFPLTDEELYSKESYAQLIKRKCDEDASLYSKIADRIPPSIKHVEKKAKFIRATGLFDE